MQMKRQGVFHLALHLGIIRRLPVVVLRLGRLVLGDSLVPVCAPPSHDRGGNDCLGSQR